MTVIQRLFTTLDLVIAGFNERASTVEESRSTVGLDKTPAGLAAGRGRSVVLVAVLAASMLLAVFVVVANWPLAPQADLRSIVGSWPGRDFVSFWSASALTLQGEAAAAYDTARLQAVEAAVVGADIKPLAWGYPPPALLLATPLALGPYPVALALWLALPLVGLALLLRRLAEHRLAPWLAAVFPGISLCLGFGQNGVLAALLLGAGLQLLCRHALLAGCLFGLLACKPQLAVLVAPALLAGGYYRALAGMIASVAILAAASVLVLGADTWSAFFAASSRTSALLSSGELRYDPMVTLFAAARLGGLPVTAAALLQGATSVVMLALVVIAWRRPWPLWLRGSLLAAAIPLATPYAYCYDLALLALPFAWLARAQTRAGASPLPLFDFGVLAAAWLAPAVGWCLAATTGVLITPIVLALLLAVIWRRGAAGALQPRGAPA
jgi:alpha-1,2-mannosyltransferase